MRDGGTPVRRLHRHPPETVDQALRAGNLAGLQQFLVTKLEVDLKQQTLAAKIKAVIALCHKQE